MNVENHLDAWAIDQAAGGHANRGVKRHLSECAACRARVARAVKMERALRAIPRAEPAPGLASRISAAVAARQAAEMKTAEPARPKPYMFAAAIGAALGTLLALALVYESGIELAANGALGFFSFFVRRPDVVVNYPGDALAAMLELLPLPQMLATLGLVVVVLMLLKSLRVAMEVSPA